MTCDELITLIQRLENLKEIGVNISVKIDYEKIYSGLAQREEKVESGEVAEPEHWQFIEKVDELSPEAKKYMMSWIC